MKITISKKDVIWSYVGTLMSMSANLLMLPFLMYFLDEDILGLWYVFTSIGAIATLFDMGFSVTFARNITYCWSGAKKLKKENVDFVDNSEPDYYLMKKVLVTCKLIYGILSTTALILLLSVGTIYIRYISRDIQSSVPIISWVIYAIAAFLNLYYGYYSSFLRGVGAVDRANKNTVLARLFQIMLTIVLLCCGTGLIGACTAYLVYGTVFRLLGKHHFYRYKNIGKHLNDIDQNIDKGEIKNLFITVWHNAWRDGAISIANYFCNQASTLICSMYLSLADVGVYSIGVQIAQAIAQISGTMYTAYQPELQSAYITSDMKKMKKSMSIIVMSFVYLFFAGTIAVIIVGIPLLRIVKPSTVVSIPVLLGLCIYQFMLKFRNCYTSYFSCTNRILYVNGFIFSAVICVILSFIMIGPLHLGVRGLIIAQIISQAVYNVWKWPLKAHLEMNLSATDMIKTGTIECINSIKGILRRNNWR